METPLNSLTNFAKLGAVLTSPGAGASSGTRLDQRSFPSGDPSHFLPLDSSRNKCSFEHMSVRADFETLKKSLQQRFPGAHRKSSVFEIARQEEAASTLHFPSASMSEVVSGRASSGMSQFLSHLLEQDGSLPVALVDGRDSFDPSSHGHEQCRRLFWIRCSEVTQALEASDLLLRDGNLPLVVLDLHLCSHRELKRIPRHIWSRFKTELRQSGVAFIVLSPSPLTPSPHQRLYLQGRFNLHHLEKETSSLQTSMDQDLTCHTSN